MFISVLKHRDWIHFAYSDSPPCDMIPEIELFHITPISHQTLQLYTIHGSSIWEDDKLKRRIGGVLFIGQWIYCPMEELSQGAWCLLLECHPVPSRLVVLDCPGDLLTLCVPEIPSFLLGPNLPLDPLWKERKGSCVDQEEETMWHRLLMSRGMLHWIFIIYMIGDPTSTQPTSTLMGFLQ